MIEKRDFRREELLGKYTVKILYKWNNRRFEEKYLNNIRIKYNRFSLFYFYFLFLFYFLFIFNFGSRVRG